MRARRLIPLAFGMAAILTIAAVGVASAGGRPFSTSLSWTEEVNASGTPNQGDPGATGHARLTMNPGQGMVCFDITVSGLSSLVTRAHIHRAAAGANGGIVVDFFNDFAGIPGNQFSGCAQASRTQILEIFHDQSNFYVNVHSVAHPAGAVRGQLGD